MMRAEQYRRFHLRKDKVRLVATLRSEANRLEREAGQLADELRRVRLTQTSPADVAITDHALVRFLERVIGIDVDAIRTQIARLIPTGALPLGAEGGPTEHGMLLVDDFQFLLTPVSLISVLTEEMDSTAWLGLTSRDEFGTPS